MMFHCARPRLPGTFGRAFYLVCCTFSVLLLLAARPAAAQVVATYDFEDGASDGWVSFNGASTPANSTAAAFSGTHSLLTTTNSSGSSSGPALTLTNLIPGATYTITGQVMLTSGASAVAVNFTVQRSDPGCSGGICYDTVGAYQVPVSATGWGQIGGSYTVSTTATSLVLYAQLIGATTAQSFYLDDVVITEIAGPPGGPQDNSGISTTFEDGNLDGWGSRAGSTLTNSTADAHSGSHSLLITSRKAAYDGPQISVNNKMYVGSTYSITVWVKLAPDATQADTLRVSLQTTLAGATSYHTVVNNTPVPLGTWVQLSIPNYSMANAYDPNQVFLYVESNSGTQSFCIDDFQLTYVPPLQIQTDIASIFQTLADYFPVGAAIDLGGISGPHAQLLTKHFNSVVSGNDMKWSSVEAAEGQFNYATADQEVSFAQKNNMKIRGHNLVWANGSQTPAWVFLESDGVTPLSASNAADVSLLTQRIQNHIMNEVQHFGSAIYVWDVVNEPLDPSQTDCLSHGPFYKVLGAKYIDVALQAARQYAPSGTQLFINDYSTTDKDRFHCLVKVVWNLRSRGIPLDGVGHEMHNHIDNPTPMSIFEAIETLARFFPGLHQQITEHDVSVYKAGDNTSNYGANGGTVPESLIAEQGWLFEKDFKELRRLKGKLDAFTFWGMADDNTWLDSFPITRLDLPLPFDTRLQAKPAYWGIIDPTQLPGYGLTVALTSQTGSRSARVFTLTATNPSSGIAYSTQINGFSLIQVWGPPCRAEISGASGFPVSLGDIPPSATATTSFTVNFEHCSERALFDLSAPWSSATYETGRVFVSRIHP